jgi:hypothetical protein
VRVSTALNRMLGLSGATVSGVRFEPAGMVVRYACGRAGCAAGATGPAGLAMTTPGAVGVTWMRVVAGYGRSPTSVACTAAACERV